MYLNSISNQVINELPLAVFNGTINLVEDPAAIPGLCEDIRRHSALGFDTETRPSFKKGRKNTIALLQLAAPGTVWLFRLKKTGLHPDLLKILQDPGIKKVGVATRDDIIGLQQYRNFKPAGFLDLAVYTDAYQISDNGLRKLAAIILKKKISKSQQLSNWEQHQLTEKQIQYASIDAWACLEIYNKLKNTSFSGS